MMGFKALNKAKQKIFSAQLADVRAEIKSTNLGFFVFFNYDTKGMEMEAQPHKEDWARQ